ncbi:MAG: Peptidyl-tRNA hydrolase (EC [uncultured Sulfurovum sp.]|uniref:Peptidyl-tRNA hydrolase n=1 Tax=uncultured Sulfurovum sp. TaxID=269237 RepID=A0A6S6SXD4_9BACT|nr:MAG: Peptidyl-tRNA hydrolase (EC [uncultured Sulfurovum sp.]
MLLIVGLGNPGKQYENTRHNIGFKVIDKLVADFGANDISKNAFRGELFKSPNLLLLKPTTYMNLSGESVQAVKNFYKIELEDIIVIHDDIDLPFSALRFKTGGGHGGHNGLRSIDAMVGKEYTRVRMGVDKPIHKSQVADYVLHDFSEDEYKVLTAWISHTTEAIKELKKSTLELVKSKYSLKFFQPKTME